MRNTSFCVFFTEETAQLFLICVQQYTKIRFQNRSFPHWSLQALVCGGLSGLKSPIKVFHCNCNQKYGFNIFSCSPVQNRVPVGCPSFLPPSSVTSCQSADWHCGAGIAGSRPDWGLFDWEPSEQTWGWNASFCRQSSCQSDSEKIVFWYQMVILKVVPVGHMF